SNKVVTVVKFVSLGFRVVRGRVKVLLSHTCFLSNSFCPEHYRSLSVSTTRYRTESFFNSCISVIRITLILIKRESCNIRSRLSCVVVYKLITKVLSVNQKIVPVACTKYKPSVYCCNTFYSIKLIFCPH